MEFGRHKTNCIFILRISMTHERQQVKIILKINLSSFTNRSSPRALINYVFVRLRLVTSMVSKCALLDLRTNTETQVT